MRISESLQLAIEAAAGGPRAEEIGFAAAGAGGLVAWVESRQDIATLVVAGGGRVLLDRSLARTDTSDYGYEGCAAQHLSWCGKHVIVVTAERYSSYLVSVEVESGAEEWMSLSHAWRIDRDLLLWVDQDPGLVRAAALPSLDARSPLPFRGMAALADVRLRVAFNRLQMDETHLLISHAEGTVIDMPALPSGRQRAEYSTVEGFIGLVERRVFPDGMTPESGRFVIEAVVQPFVRPIRKARSRWTPSPVWMPVYWYRYLVLSDRGREAAQFLALLDAIAASLAETEPEAGWEAEWTASKGAVELASRYVRRQCRSLAVVCRKGELPAGWQCLLFDPAPQSSAAGSRVDVMTLTPALLGVFERLVGTNPARLASGKWK